MRACRLDPEPDISTVIYGHWEKEREEVVFLIGMLSDVSVRNGIEERIVWVIFFPLLP